MRSRAAFEALASGLAGTSLHEQWDSLVAKVGGKVFVLRGMDDGPAPTTFKVPELSFELLTSVEGISQAAYFARRQWVTVEPGALSEDELAGYIRQSHAIVTAKLTRKLRAELGIA
jgi:predicted DNA-binding protein (MmcQ/YjbR family)